MLAQPPKKRLREVLDRAAAALERLPELPDNKEDITDIRRLIKAVEALLPPVDTSEIRELIDFVYETTKDNNVVITNSNYGIWTNIFKELLPLYGTQQLKRALTKYFDMGWPVDKPFCFKAVVNNALRGELGRYKLRQTVRPAEKTIKSEIVNTDEKKKAFEKLRHEPGLDEILRGL